MENRAHALTAGLFTLLLGAAIFVAIWWFSGSSQEYNAYQLIATRGVVGLNAQAPVKFQGVNVGRVSNIELDGIDHYRVIITINVRSNVVLTHRTRAKLEMQGITGTSYILLYDDVKAPGSDSTPLSGENGQLPRITLQPSLIEQATDSGRIIIDKLQESSTRLNSLLNDDNLSNAKLILKNMAETSSKLDKTLTQANALLEDSRRFTTSGNAQAIKESLTHLQSASKDIAPALQNFNRAMEKIEAAGGRFNKLGADVQDETLPKINQLLLNLQSTSAQLNQVLDDVDRSPQLLLRGRESGQPGPGEGRSTSKMNGEKQ